MLCLERKWTVGDVGCVNDATTYDDVKNCAVVAKIVLADEQASALEQAQVAKARQEEEELRKLKAALAEQRKKTDRLLALLANAEDDAERAKLQQQLDDERARTKSITGGASADADPRHAPPTKKCKPGDPLCSDI
jgi:hypothetical protein